ncbi:MAG: DUF3617 domain-containing protein [Thermodesulfobacteriota bacterium]
MKVMAAGVIGVLAIAGVASADETLKEGKWEFTTEVQMPGMAKMPELPAGVKLPPGMSMSSKGNTMRTTQVKCITKEDMVPADQGKGKNTCKTTKMERRGNTVNWSVVCEEEGTRMLGDGVATYTGDTMQSTMTMTTTRAGQTTKQDVKSMGRYLGACK